MSDLRPSENTDDRLTFPVMTELFGRPGVPMSEEDIEHHELHVEAPNPLDALVAELATTNRHLEAIANELRLKNRVVGL